MGVYTLALDDGSQVEVEAPRDTPLQELLMLAQQQRRDVGSEERLAARRTKQARLEEAAAGPVIVPKDARTALGRGIGRGIDSLQQNLGSAIEGVGGLLGLEGVEEYGANVALENEAALQRSEMFSTRLDDIGGVGTGASYVGELAGESAPQMGAVAAGAAAGAIAGSAFFGVGAVPGAIIGSAIGGFAAGFPLFFGSNRERQKDAIDQGLKTEVSEGAAALAAIPQAALDSILTVVGAKFFLRPAGEAAGGLLTRARRGATAGVLVEVPTEIGQAVLERGQAGLSLTSAEAMREYGEAGLAAGILGGGIGGIGGAVGPRGAPEVDPNALPEGIAGLLPAPTEDELRIASTRQLQDSTSGEAIPMPAPPKTLTGPEDLGVQLDEGTGEATTREQRIEEGEKRREDQTETRDIEALLETDRIEALKTFQYTKKDRKKIAKKKAEAVKKEAEAAKVEQELDEMIRVTEDDANVAVRKARAKKIEEETEALGTVVEPEFDLDAIVRASTEETATGKLDTERAKKVQTTRTKILQDTVANAKEIRNPAALQRAFESELVAKNVSKPEATPAEVASLTRASNVLKAKTPEGITPLVEPAVTTEVEALKDPRQQAMEDKVAPKPVEEIQASLPTLGRKRDLGTPPQRSGQDTLATAKPTVQPKIVDTALFDDLGVPPSAPIRKRVINKDLNDTGVRQEFATLAGNKNTSGKVKTNINRMLADTPEAQLDLPFIKTKTKAKEQTDVTPKEIKSDASGVSVPLVKQDVAKKPKGGVSSVTDSKTDSKVTGAFRASRVGSSVVEPRSTDGSEVGKQAALKTKPKKAVVSKVSKEEADRISKRAVERQKIEARTSDAKQAVIYKNKSENIRTIGAELDAGATVEGVSNSTKKAILAEMSKDRTKATPVRNAIQRYFGQFPSFDAAITQAIDDVASGQTRKADSNDFSGNLPQQVREREFYVADAANNLPSMGNVSGARVLKWLGVDVKKGAVKVLDEGNGSKALREYIATELRTEITAYADINNRQKSSIKLQEQQRRNLAADKLDEEVARDNEVNRVFKLPAELAVDIPVRPPVRKALLDGRLQDALVALQFTAGSRDISKLAKTLAENIGNTKLIIKKKLKADDGTPVAGYFDPETNTIALDEETGINAHALLHEMFHAVTSATIANKSHPLTKKLNKIFEGVKEQLAGEYGLNNLDEFVAEYQANPDFSTQLKTTTVNGRNPFQQLVRAIANFVRTLIGRPTVPETSTFDAVDKLVQEIIAPTYDGRAATKMYMQLKIPKDAGEAINNLASKIAINAKGKNLYDYIQLSRNFMGSKIPLPAKKLWLDLQPVNILTELSESRIPGAKQLNNIINNMSASLRVRNASLDPIVADLRRFKKKNLQKFNTLQSLVPNATYERIDPREADFDKAYGFKQADVDPDNVKIAREIHKKLRAQYNSLGTEGQDLYKVVTFTFEKSLLDVMDAVNANLAATIADPKGQKRVKDKLVELLNQERGTIKPFAPLTREGIHRLQYNAIDPKTGIVETFVEYFKTMRQREKAKVNLQEYNKTSLAKLPANDPRRAQVNVEPISGTKEGKRDFSKAPDGSFVYNVLKVLEAEKADPETVNRILDLAIDSMPERSFMQSFRQRKDVRGFLGDVTPTGMAAEAFNLVDMVQNKGRDYNRQLVQMEFGAKIQTFQREVLEKIDPDSTDTTTALYKSRVNQIANFAKNPNIPRWSQSLTAAGYAWTMGWNLSSAAITTFDVFMSTTPRLMGKYGDKATFKAMGSAAAILAKSPKTKMIEVMGPEGKMIKRKVNVGIAGFSIGNYDYTDPNLSSELKDIEVLADIATENAQINQSLNQEELDMGNAKDRIEKINSWTSFLFHHSERYNREIAMTANYLLELNRMKTKKGSALTLAEKQKAAMVAIDETQFTLGATASAGRPVLAQGPIGNVAMLFKRFAISKYHMMATMTNDAFQAGGDANTKENRRIAQHQLGRFLISTGLFAGVAGMPLMGALGQLYDAVHDDSEDDFDAMLRKTVGEGFYKGIVNAALGVDVASRIGMNSLLYRPPIIDKDQAGLVTLVEQLGGPLVGIYMSFDRGYDLFAEGENLKGVEAILPAALRNVVKGGKQITTGEVATRRGDAVVEDIGVGQILGQFAGFANEDLIRQYDINKNERRKVGYLGKQRTTLLRKANIAAANGDSDAYKQAIKEIREYNRSLPRAARGKNIILADTIKRSRKAFGTRTSKMIGGIEYTPLMRRSLEEYDQGLQIFN